MGNSRLERPVRKGLAPFQVNRGELDGAPLWSESWAGTVSQEQCEVREAIREGPGDLSMDGI